MTKRLTGLTLSKSKFEWLTTIARGVKFITISQNFRLMNSNIPTQFRIIRTIAGGKNLDINAYRAT